MSKFRQWLNARGIAGGWIAVQWNGAHGLANRAAFPRVLNAARADGNISAGPWLTRDFSAVEARAVCVQAGGDLFVAEAEIPAFANGQPNPQAQDWPELVQHLSDLDIDKAVGTSYTPFRDAQGLPSKALAQPLMDDGWYCLPYVYPAEHLGVTVAQQMAYAQHYAPEWAAAEPVLGVYGGFTVTSPAFAGWKECNGASLWDAGEVGL